MLPDTLRTKIYIIIPYNSFNKNAKQDKITTVNVLSVIIVTELSLNKNARFDMKN